MVTWLSPGSSSKSGLGGAVGTTNPASNVAFAVSWTSLKLLNTGAVLEVGMSAPDARFL
jgi:Na+/phosphate symporter